MPKKLFTKGNRAACANKGKPKLTGRTLALLTLDSILKEAQSRDKLTTALRAHLNRNPLAFFKDVVMPLIPKSALERVEADARGEDAARQRVDVLLEAKGAAARALEHVGQTELSEAVCKSIDSLSDDNAVNEVVIELS